MLGCLGLGLAKLNKNWVVGLGSVLLGSDQMSWTQLNLLRWARLRLTVLGWVWLGWIYEYYESQLVSTLTDSVGLGPTELG